MTWAVLAKDVLGALHTPGACQSFGAPDGFLKENFGREQESAFEVVDWTPNPFSPRREEDIQVEVVVHGVSESLRDRLRFVPLVKKVRGVTHVGGLDAPTVSGDEAKFAVTLRFNRRAAKTITSIPFSAQIDGADIGEFEIPIALDFDPFWRLGFGGGMSTPITGQSPDREVHPFGASATIGGSVNVPLWNASTVFAVRGAVGAGLLYASHRTLDPKARVVLAEDSAKPWFGPRLELLMELRAWELSRFGWYAAFGGAWERFGFDVQNSAESSTSFRQWSLLLEVGPTVHVESTAISLALLGAWRAPPTLDARYVSLTQTEAVPAKAEFALGFRTGVDFEL